MRAHAAEAATPHLIGTTNGREDVEALMRRARLDARTAHLSQAKLSRLVRALLSGNRDSVPASRRYMLEWVDPTGSIVAHEVDQGRSSLGTLADRAARGEVAWNVPT